VPLTDFSDTMVLAFDETELPDDGRREPLAAAALRLFDSAEVLRLDPTRTDLGPDPPSPRRSIWRGLLGSLLVHLLPLLVLISWPGTPLDIPAPIPIQLVVEQPPPPPPAPPPATQPAPPAKPPPMARASDDFGNPDAKKNGPPPNPGEPQPSAAESQPAAAATAPPSEPAAAKDAATKPPEPQPTETQVSAVPPPAPPKPPPPKHEAVVHLPKPEGLMLPLPLSPETPREAAHAARLPGPDATRDEYLAYALTLTMRHVDLLPLSLLGARHGDTTVAFRVLADGTIGTVRVVHGSGYADIDDRIAQMVVAVGRFPPLPQWITTPSMEFAFHLHFPHPAEH